MRSLFLNALLVFLLVSSFSVQAQENKVSWTSRAVQQADNSYVVTYTGKIASGWHLYTIPDVTEELSGITTTPDDSSFVFGAITIVSKTDQFKDPVFSGKILQVAFDSIIFTQSVKINGPATTEFSAGINYEVCNATSKEFYPESQQVKILTGSASIASAPVSKRILIPTIDLNNPVHDCSTATSTSGIETDSHNLLKVFFIGLAGGLASLLLPCLFPMIPLTVSFFTNKAGSRRRGIFNAFLYGFFIFLIYIGITLPFHLFEKINPSIFNNISTGVGLNVAFFAIFIFFALSFFGLYEINLPSGISNKADSKASHQSIWGIFFMALTLTIVSFSCTGPIAGSLLAGVANGEGGAMRLTVGMAGFGMAIGLPFAIFALFPNMLNSLPKSGGWLNTVKVFFGFLEVGFAFKFLSNADLVQHWGILKREIFIAIWIIDMLLLALYLWGVFKFKHDSPVKKLSPVRIVMAIIVSLFTLYLVPGVTNTKYNNLSFISGFPPPLYYSIYKSGEDCVLNLNCTRDYEAGLKMAREQKKHILLDFTGYACVNCRRMEENVWSTPKVYNFMKEHFIVISLYVDDKKLLPSAQRFIYKNREGTERNIRTVGDKWATFETENFKNNAQPLYAILDTDEKLMSHPVAYTKSPKEYLQWLSCSIGMAADRK